MNVRHLAAAMLAGLLLSACTDDPPDPDATPTPTASSTPTPTETTDPTDEPSSAEDFIRSWFELYMDLQTTGESEEFETLSARCEPCMSTVERYHRIYENGGQIEGGVITVSSARQVDQQTWIARVSVTPTKFTESEGSEQQSLPGGKGAFRFILKQSGSSFEVLDLFQESV